MGFGGFGVAIAVIFLLIYLVPQALRNRQVLGDTPIDERFAEDLRLITDCTHTPAKTVRTHGKIFLTERTMTPMITSDNMRNAARERSRARARMATRRANQKRGIMIGAVLALLTFIAWGVVAFASMSSAIAIGTTVLTGAYIATFGYVVNEMVKADDVDTKRIANANKILHGKVAPRARALVVNSEPVIETRIPDISVEKTEEKVLAEPAQPATPVVRKMTRQELDARAAAFAVSPAPSYTLKSVAPLVPTEHAEGEVPFRPTKLYERLGDETMPQANPAPEMTGQEELRQDVLGGGSTLDALLSRRRA
ncbi:hypothetical protein [Arcanobacterium buesumense]|uniref:Uncharacterized protein n=1 Tax=Arcanobacterium buesumense TaxID=2722751 RepID=A0A6H2EMY6_9ACTO|nr:hypothetical protein [Arcanobacterium buesumense]QJC22436.1 hypothetical protein HC352_07910 [Arcanobacterium buesumense]